MKVAFLMLLSDMLAPLRLVLVKLASGMMASSMLALLRFLFVKSAPDRFILSFTAVSKQFLKEVKCPSKSVLPLFVSCIL